MRGKVQTFSNDQTIMDIAGHVSKQMLARYSHVRMEAKRRALDAVGTKQRTAQAVQPEQKGTAVGTLDSQEAGAQKWAQ